MIPGSEFGNIIMYTCRLGLLFFKERNGERGWSALQVHQQSTMYKQVVIALRHFQQHKTCMNRNEMSKGQIQFNLC